MKLRPSEFEFHVAASPLVSVYEHEWKLRGFLDRIETEFRKEAKDSAHLIRLIDKGLTTLGLGTPMRAVFIDGSDGAETDQPEYVCIPVLMIIPHGLGDEIYPTLQ